MFDDKLKFSDESYESIKQLLSSASISLIPIHRPEFSILERLEERLFALRTTGFSFNEISALFLMCGIDIEADTIKEFYLQAQEKRLLACEQRILEYSNTKIKDAERSAKIEHGLRETLQSGTGLSLHYQPQINMHSGKILGAEALVRWKFNDVVIRPDEFIPVAEQTGLIGSIGEWVLREACREAKRWDSLGIGGKQGIRMAVNLSVNQLSDELPELITGILDDSDLPTDALELEVTESLLVGDQSLRVLNSLRNSGIRLSVDDFGTGYSCFATLKNLPVDTIKIDRSFIQDIHQGGNSLAVVESIVHLANKLNMNTLAEGVESEEQIEALLELGCSVCQGYFYSKPVPGDEFVRFAQSR